MEGLYFPPTLFKKEGEKFMFGSENTFKKYNDGIQYNPVEGTQTAYAGEGVNDTLNTMRASGSPYVGAEYRNMAVTSTNISIYVNDMKIGFVQSFSPQEQRTITPIQELGTEGVVQMVAGNTNGGSISVSRFAIYNSNLFDALGITPTGKNTVTNPFKTLKDQRVPFEIKVETNMANGAVARETYIDCWLTSYSKTIAAQTITINESCNISYSDVMYEEVKGGSK